MSENAKRLGVICHPVSDGSLEALNGLKVVGDDVRVCAYNVVDECFFTPEIRDEDFHEHFRAAGFD